MGLEFEKVENIIRLALSEDIGAGDITTISCIPEGRKARARIIAKAGGIICGLELIGFMFRIVDSSVKVRLWKKDGDTVSPGDAIAEIDGQARPILSVERTLLNFLQNLSGVATTTGRYVKLIGHTNTKLLDTRKTTPGMRYLQKYSVKTGGGENHRMGLFDMVLIKDNHIKVNGSITGAVAEAEKNAGKGVKIEVECATLDEVNEAIATGCDWIMLDNMDVQTMKKAVKLINRKKMTEASGGITADNIAEAASTGVDYISVGALTHSYKSLDLSMKTDII